MKKQDEKWYNTTSLFRVCVLAFVEIGLFAGVMSVVSDGTDVIVRYVLAATICLFTAKELF